MNDQTASDILAILNAAISIWATHSGKPDGWKPTAQDYQDLRDSVDDATPENVKAAAAKRLGVPWPPV